MIKKIKNRRFLLQTELKEAVNINESYHQIKSCFIVNEIN